MIKYTATVPGQLSEKTVTNKSVIARIFYAMIGEACSSGPVRPALPNKPKPALLHDLDLPRLSSAKAAAICRRHRFVYEIANGNHTRRRPAAAVISPASAASFPHVAPP